VAALRVLKKRKWKKSEEVKEKEYVMANSLKLPSLSLIE
jgi:hypothetical protein